MDRAFGSGYQFQFFDEKNVNMDGLYDYVFSLLFANLKVHEGFEILYFLLSSPQLSWIALPSPRSGKELEV